MGKTDLTYYSIIRYVPDPTREEQVNIGVLVATETGAAGEARFVKNWSRIRWFGREDITFLRDFAHSLEGELKPQLPMFSTRTEGRWNLEFLQRLDHEWQNSIQITPPRVSTLPMSRLLDEVFARFVREPPTRHRGFRDKRAATSKVSRAVRRALQGRFPKTEVLGCVKSHQWIKGKLDEHQFDLTIENESPLLAAQGLSFEVPESKELEKDIDVLAWALDDLRAARIGVRIGVVALPPIGKHVEYDRASRIYKTLGADFVPEPEINAWAVDVVRALPTHLGESEPGRKQAE